MKRIMLGIIIIAVLMLVGCNKTATNRQPDPASSPASNPTSSATSDPTSSPTSSPSDYDKKYTDKTHKQIQYGKLLIDLDKSYFDYHIVSDTRSDNIETFKVELDNATDNPESQMTNVTIRTIEKQNFLNTEQITSYLSSIIPDYEKIKIYNNVTDDSGIISLYSVTGGNLTNYLVSYSDETYLVESDYKDLDIYLFDNFIKANYERNNQKIENANSFTTNVNQTIYYNKDQFDKAKYDIVQGKGGNKYSAELSFDNKEYINDFTLNNEKGENQLTLSTDASGNNEDFAIKFLDVNMDGYTDIQFLEAEGAMNNSYALYVWDDSANNFVKVKCDEMLSEIEVHDGYLNNWQKGDAVSGVKQKLVWKTKNTLTKESEEDYKAE